MENPLAPPGSVTATSSGTHGFSVQLNSIVLHLFTILSLVLLVGFLVVMIHHWNAFWWIGLLGGLFGNSLVNGLFS